MSKLYEMHIYTMGTRTYAEAVVNEIDPKGELFNDRILSRDDSGSMTQKRLERLFPSNTSKVVILDDRADVWSFSPNLIQIKPYEYFVGIGDINSPFLPKGKKEAISTSEQVKSDADDVDLNTKDKVGDENTSSTKTQPEQQEEKADNADNVDNADLNTQDKVGDENTSSTNTQPEQQEENTDTSDAQAETENNEPDSQDQDDTSQSDDTLDEKQSSDTDDNIPPPVASLTEQQIDPTPKAPGTEEPLTNPGAAGVTEHSRVDQDTILPIMSKALTAVHDEFYKEIDLGNTKPDVAEIIPRLKSKVLAGTHFVFSGVIPLQQAPQNSLIWKTATTFGAECGLELTGKVTHLIAAGVSIFGAFSFVCRY
jgi:RNA polymerase II subunit A-like phosphatase